jgi:hypothetical protein
MRKTLRALFLGSALAAAATPALPQQLPTGPVPPTVEQQQVYELLNQLLQMDAVIAEGEVHSLERLEDQFYAGTLPEAEYRLARAAALRAMYPELAATHEEFEGRTNKLVGCTADGRSFVLPVITMVNRADMNALFERLVGTGATNNGATRYLNTVTDMANRLRQGLESQGAVLVGGIKSADLNTPEHMEKIKTALAQIAALAARDAQVHVEFRTLQFREVDILCTPPGPQATPTPATTTTPVVAPVLPNGPR